MQGQFILEFIEYYIKITGDLFVDTVLFFTIVLFSGFIGLYLFGKVFNYFIKKQSKLITTIDWILRFLVFIVLIYLFIILARKVSIIFLPSISYYLVGSIMVVMAFVLFILINRKKKQDKTDKF